MRNIEKKLQNIRTKSLTEAEKNNLWLKISREISAREQSVFIWPFSILKLKPMAYILLAIFILLGGSSATVIAADNSKPGDLLFPIDITAEKILIMISPKGKRNGLKIKFAQERLEEAEETLQLKINKLSRVNILTYPSGSATSTPSQITFNEIEAYIGKSKTFVHVEFNGFKDYFVIETTDESEIIAEIAGKFNVSESDIEPLIKFNYEGSDNKIEEKEMDNLVSINDLEEAQNAVNSALDYLKQIKSDFINDGNETAAADIDFIIDKLSTLTKQYLENLDKVMVKIKKDDGENEIKFKAYSDELKIKLKLDMGDDGKNKVKFKYDSGNAKTKIKIENNISSGPSSTTTVDYYDGHDEEDEKENHKNKNNGEDTWSNGHNHDEEDNNDLDYDSESTKDDNENGLTEVEAEVNDGKTKVKVEFNDKKTKFTLQSTDKESVIAEIMDRLNVSRSEVESVLEFKTED